MIDGNTAALDAHLSREDAAQAARDALTPIAIDNLTEAFWKGLESGGDGHSFIVDEFCECSPTDLARISRAAQAGDHAALGRIVAQGFERALSAFIDHFESRELDRLQS